MEKEAGGCKAASKVREALRKAHTPGQKVREALMFSARLRLPSSVPKEQVRGRGEGEEGAGGCKAASKGREALRKAHTPGQNVREALMLSARLRLPSTVPKEQVSGGARVVGRAKRLKGNQDLLSCTGAQGRLDVECHVKAAVHCAKGASGKRGAGA